jgi:protein disulfide-isomerase
MMTIRILVLSILFCFNILYAETITWYSNLEKAKQIALKSKKPLLIFYKDQSSWSFKMEKLFEDPFFQKKAKSLFAFCKLDKKSSNSSFAPKITLLDLDYDVITEVGYMPFSSEKYLAYLQEKIVNYLQIKQVALSSKSIDLKKAYLNAIELGCLHFQKEILNKGVSQNIPFFLLAKFESLLQASSMEDAEMFAIKEQMQKLDPKNLQKLHYGIAILEFQKLAFSPAGEKEVIVPLLNYIEQYGKKDKKDLWKVHLTISQYLSGKKKYHKALFYCRESYKSAPKKIKRKILETIKYLKSKIKADK